MLVNAKSAVNNILDLQGPLDRFYRDFPHTIDGGWDAVHPEDDFILYAQVDVGIFAGIAAACRGSPRIRRERGVALAMLIHACLMFPDRITAGRVDGHVSDLSQWACEAFRLKRQLENSDGYEQEGSEIEAERLQANQEQPGVAAGRASASSGGAVRLRAARDCA